MNDFNQVRENIIDMLEDLDEQLTEIIEEGREAKEHGKLNFENSSFLDSIWNKTHSEMDKIKHAISQIGSGRYSLCTDCGKPVKKDQLSKTSSSRLCEQCAKKENGNVS